MSSITVPNAIYHVYSRSAPSDRIFESDELKAYFRNKLASFLQKHFYRCYGWSLMDDHYHLVLHSSDLPVSSFVQRLNTSFGLHYKKIHTGIGSAFEGRPASVIVQDKYLKPLVRWVHLNPVRKGICTLKDLGRYEWCGHKEILTGDSEINVIDMTGLLDYFPGNNPRGAYRRYMKSENAPRDDYLIQSVRNVNRGSCCFTKAESWVIGDPEFTSLAFRQDGCKMIRVARYLRDNVTIDCIAQQLTSAMKIRTEDLKERRPPENVSVARKLFAFLAARCFDFSPSQIAGFLGISTGTVSKLINGGFDYLKDYSLPREALKLIINHLPAYYRNIYDQQTKLLPVPEE